MRVTKSGTSFDIILEGSIGETTPIFTHDLREATTVQVDGSKMTYINSIGVKNWIIWTSRVPSTCRFNLRHLPLVMVNQASQVKGFLPRHARIDSFTAPYACPKCNAETAVKLLRGKHYEYAAPGKTRMIQLPSLDCAKCKTTMEPDFLELKVFVFLNETK